MILAIEIEYLLVTAEYRCNKLNLGIRYTIWLMKYGVG